MTRESRSTSTDALVTEATRLFGAGLRLATLAVHDDGDDLRLVYVFLGGPPDRRVELVVRVPVAAPEFPSLAALDFPAGRLEREARDLFGVVPVGHDSPRPLVRHGHWPADWFPMRAGAGPRPALGGDDAPFPFATVAGDGVYEIPVGPVHAGLIEPGHFRFSVVGETILRMTARLWFVHRGLERLAEGRSIEGARAVAERVSGDNCVAHALAYALAVEEAAGLSPSVEVTRGRAVLLELERVHNHVADLGAMCNDVAFSVAHARSLELRERILRLLAEMTGHRLGRGAVRPGGLEVSRLPRPGELAPLGREVVELVELALSNSVVVDRFDGTGALGFAEAEQLGVLGVVGRASGRLVDARWSHPWHDGPAPDPVVRIAGDVRARFDQRVDEVAASLAEVERLVGGGECRPQAQRGLGSGLGVVEAARGTVVHRVEVADGRVTRLRVADPSFTNWPALALSLRETIVPDFPLVNKSFNLSYAGNDL